MSESVAEAPYSIASLPRPLDTKNGRTYLSSVYSIRGTRKRKRHEVAVGVDGECVNVYNIQTQAVVASHALSPQTYLCYAPLSIYIRASEKAPSERRTYAVLKEKTGDAKRRLVCFTQTRCKDAGSAHATSRPEQRHCALEDGEIVGLYAATSQKDEGPTIVVSYKSGRVLCASSNLQKTETLRQPNTTGSTEENVEYSDLLSADAVKKGMLKNRPDVVASLDEATTSHDVLFSISRSADQRHANLYAVRLPGHAVLQMQKPSLQPLVEWGLPWPQPSTKRAPKYGLHAPSGKLFQLINRRLHVHDLSGAAPRQIAVLGSDTTPVRSFSPISSSLAITASETEFYVHETKYGALFGTVPVSTTDTSGTARRKRKLEDGFESEPQPTIDQLCSIADEGPIVALRGRALMVINLTEGMRDRKRAKLQQTSLSEIVRRKRGSVAVDQSYHDLKQSYADWIAKVDELIESGDLDGLEELVAEDPRLGQRTQVEKAANHDPAAQTNGHTTNGRLPGSDEWPLSPTPDPSLLDRRRVLYLLANFFDHAEGQLRIRVASTKLLRWLALTGFLNASQIWRAWVQNGKYSIAQRDIQPQPGDVIAAIRSLEDDIELIHLFLTLPSSWEIEEVVQALKIIEQSFEDTNPAQGDHLALPPIPQPQLTNGDVHITNGDEPPTNGDLDSQIDAESKAAEHELDYAMKTLNDGFEVRSMTLRIIFARLLAFEPHRVTVTLRRMLSHRGLLVFINILRLELANGGWTSRYISSMQFGAGTDEQMGMVDAIDGAEEGGPSDEAIKTIGDLLNCAVDALGSSGWLVGLSSAPVPAAELLGNLQAEVYAGLEGCHEAEALGCTLREIERAVGEMRGGQIGRGDEAILPIGRALFERNNMRKKSKIALAQEKSRRVGSYSFERIRI